MLVASISDFRSNIKQYLDKVSLNFETLIINTGKSNGIVLMSLDEYNSLMTFNYVLSSKTNEARLDSAIEKLNRSVSFEKDLLEN